MTHEEKLENWARREFARAVPSMILADHKGTLLAFGKYRIEQQPQQVQLYVNEEPTLTFSDRRSALSWCVAQKHKDFNLARRITQLDQKKWSISNDIDTRTVLAHRSRDTRYKNMVHNKLLGKMRHRAEISDQLEQCISQAKYIQI